MEDITQLVIGSWGPIKTCKTTLGLSYPTPWVLFDFDLGFNRAKYRLPWIQPGKTLIEVPWNLSLSKDLINSADMIVKSYKLPIKFPKQLVRGWLSLWEDEVLPDITLVMENSNTKSILYDTGTVMWNLGKDAQLERAQNNAVKRNESRESLLQIEYSMPNQEMRAVLGSAKHYGKNLYISHHLGGKYEDKITSKGKESIRIGDTWDGWSHLGAIVDVIVRTDTALGPMRVGMPPEKTPTSTIETCGYSLEAEGKTVPVPTFNSILNFINESRNEEGLALSTVQLNGGVIPTGVIGL